MKLRIKDLGPIRGGYSSDDGFLSFPKVTLFCGPQGSGKSTAAKLFSSMSWLEKWIYRNPDFVLTNEFMLETLAWQGLDDYLMQDTEFVYEGDLYRILFKNGAVEMKKIGDEKLYLKPKVSYMPAERNFASIIRNALGVANLPKPLLDMQVEFENAKRKYKAGYKLPSNGYGFRYDTKTGESWIVNGEDHGDGSSPSRTHLENASSGLQSMVPLMLVSDYLSNRVDPDYDVNKSGLYYNPGTPEQKIMVERHIHKVMRSDKSQEVKLENLMRYLAPGKRFINIVEEPEQNLYPETQYRIVEFLLRKANAQPSNKLLISTHSPFVVNSMVTASMAKSLFAMPEMDRISNTREELESLFPEACAVAQSEMALYEFSDDGSISQLDADSGVFSDANLLNRELDMWNERFGNMLAIKARLSCD